MARPHTITQKITVPVGHTDLVYPADCPTRVGISRIRIVSANHNKRFAVTVFDRAFKLNPMAVASVFSAATPLVGVTLAADGVHTQLNFLFPPYAAMSVGSSFAIAGNGLTAYNTTHTVTELLGPAQCVTDQVYVGTGSGGHMVNANCVVTFLGNIAYNFTVGDVFSIVGNSVSNYNNTPGHAATFTITAVLNANCVLTSTTYISDGHGGTLDPTGNYTWPLAVIEVGRGFNGNAQVTFSTPHYLQDFDNFTMSNNSVAGYNSDTFGVTQVIDQYTVLTDQTYTALGYGGEVTLALPLSAGSPAEPAAGYAFEFIAQRLADTDYIWRYDEPHGVPYVCQDPPINNLPVRKMYFHFDTADTYEITITSLTDWHG